jgi:hypothetical protein
MSEAPVLAITDEIRSLRALDGEAYISVKDIVSVFLTVHDQLTSEGFDSDYEDIAVALATPFMEEDAFEPLHIVPSKGAHEDK